MPFSGPEGQGPFETMDECIDAMADEEGVDDPAALCAYWKELDENQANAMTEPTDEPEYRAYHQGQPRLREVDDESEEGMMTIRMPIASTGEVRNEGDDPLTRDEIDGMARQINERDVGVFLAHGDSTELTAARYGQTERLGNWQDANVLGADEREESDGTDLLMADAVMPDPETLPNGVGRFREVLGILKEQAKRGIGMSASIGWREDEDAPGGNDLMEASIVGIPADPRTMTQDGPAVAVARAAVEAGADPEALVEAVREAVTGDRDPATDHDMTDNEDTEPDAENEAEGTDDEETTERQEAPEWASRLLEMQEAQTDTLQSIADALREEDEDDDDDDDDEEEENESDDDEDEEDEDEENSQDADVTADQREALETLRDGGFNVDDLDLPEPDDEQDADADSDGSEPEPDTRDTDTDDEHPLDKYAFPQ